MLPGNARRGGGDHGCASANGAGAVEGGFSPPPLPPPPSKSVSSTSFARSSAVLLASLAVVNGAVWAAAAATIRPALGLALVAWTLGLRHALDADHIAAIDNVTRLLLVREAASAASATHAGKANVAVDAGSVGPDGGRMAAAAVLRSWLRRAPRTPPATTGLFFSLGHSVVVVAVSAAVAAASGALDAVDGAAAGGFGTAGTAVSAAFLLLVAAANAAVLVQLVRRGAPARPGRGDSDGDKAAAARPVGCVGRASWRLVQAVDRPWKMAVVGLVFGLAFDTATEVALLGVAAEQGAARAPAGVPVLLAVLFAAGMALVDSIDSVAMVWTYSSAASGSGGVGDGGGRVDDDWKVAVVDGDGVVEARQEGTTGMTDQDVAESPAQHRDGIEWSNSGTAETGEVGVCGGARDAEAATTGTNGAESEWRVAVLRYRFNILLTLLSSLVAALVGVVELLGLVEERVCGDDSGSDGSGNGGGCAAPAGAWFWAGVTTLGDRSELLGAAVAACFLACLVGFLVLATRARRGAAARADTSSSR
ncbi:hypothetical protein HK405_012616 [Cladochytrium tenue]|nr:hypothetical protein HK405_012616 [Cladochytrium tenue]